MDWLIFDSNADNRLVSPRCAMAEDDTYYNEAGRIARDTLFPEPRPSKNGVAKPGAVFLMVFVHDEPSIA